MAGSRERPKFVNFAFESLHLFPFGLTSEKIGPFSRIKPSIAFDVMALRNELRVLPRYCEEFVKCFRDVCRLYAKSGTD